MKEAKKCERTLAKSSNISAAIFGDLMELYSLTMRLREFWAIQRYERDGVYKRPEDVNFSASIA